MIHGGIKIDDSVLMFGNSSDKFPPNKLLTHVYVEDVDTLFRKAGDLGCETLEKTKDREGDPDRRGSFKDFAGNTWSVGTQVNEEK